MQQLVLVVLVVLPWLLQARVQQLVLVVLVLPWLLLPASFSCRHHYRQKAEA